MRWRRWCIILPGLFLGSCDTGTGADSGAGGDGSVGAGEEAPVTNWVLFRGDSAMRGISTETLRLPLRLKWSFATEEPIMATAVIDAGRAYVGSTSGLFYCLNLENGEEVWSHDTEFGIEGSACLLEDKVVVGAKDGFVYAFAKEDGKVLWKAETEDQVLGGVNVHVDPSNPEKAVLLVGSYDYNLYCLDASDGSEVWKIPTDNFVNGTPTVSDGRVIFGGCDGLLHIVAIDSGEEIAAVEIGAYISNSAAVDNNIAYVAHYGNKVEAFDLSTQERVWEFSDRSFEYYASPAVTADLVFAGGRDKRLHCLDRVTGEQRWEFVARRDVDSSPVVCPNAVFFGSQDGRLYAVDPAEGTELWSYDIGAAITSSPAIAEGILVVCGEDGVVYAFESGDNGPTP